MSNFSSALSVVYIQGPYYSLVYLNYLNDNESFLMQLIIRRYHWLKRTAASELSYYKGVHMFAWNPINIVMCLKTGFSEVRPQADDVVTAWKS